eukprot:1195398-Prorocentrum_minimum.AAC.5
MGDRGWSPALAVTTKAGEKNTTKKAPASQTPKWHHLYGGHRSTAEQAIHLNDRALRVSVVWKSWSKCDDLKAWVAQRAIDSSLEPFAIILVAAVFANIICPPRYCSGGERLIAGSIIALGGDPIIKAVSPRLAFRAGYLGTARASGLGGLSGHKQLSGH